MFRFKCLLDDTLIFIDRNAEQLMAGGLALGLLGAAVRLLG